MGATVTRKWSVALIALLALGGCDRIQEAFSTESTARSTQAGLEAYRAGKFDEAREAWLGRANAGDADAAYYLGVLANEGHGGDAAEALRWFLEAAAKGHSKAQYNVALAFERGLGTTRDRKKAIEWLTKASTKDNEAQYMLGLLLIDEAGDPPDQAKTAKAIEWVRKAAESGNPRASYQLGSIYWEGTLVDADPDVARHWYERALAGGMVETLRPLMEARKVLEELDNRDIATLRRDAEKGDSQAQHVLASRLFRGLGVKRDNGEGLRWLEKAAAGGYLAAQYDLGMVLSQGEAADTREGMRWIRKAADSRYARAQYAVAQTYAEGIGTDKDEATAVTWYRQAAEQDLPEAEYAMGYSYSEGSGVQRDDAQAMQWFKRAASHGHAEAAFRISTMHANGEGVMKDPQEVKRWECRAMVLGSARAAENLSRRGGFDIACADYADDLARFAVGVLGAASGSNAEGSTVSASR